MTTPVITVENLSKAYRIGLKEEIPDTFMGALTGWITAPVRNWKRLRRLDTFGVSPESRVQGRELQSPGTRGEGPRPENNGNGDSSVPGPWPLNPQPVSDIIWALNDVSFEVQEGEVLGIIGSNGAGKSTLLKVLSRITEPTSGRAMIRGRVSSLLEVGTGFHPELTGRENIYMNGTILGMTKREIDRKFDEIVDFSGVEAFLDTPIKRYSSGMKVRLAFSVAAHLQPEILIVDEVLAVGDAEFKKKCLGKMQDVAGSGRTILFVSHNMSSMRQLCSRTVWLRDGRLEQDGGTREVVDAYLASASSSRGPQVSRVCLSEAPRDGDDGKLARLTSCELVSTVGESHGLLRFGEPFDIRLKGVAYEDVAGLGLVVGFDADAGTRIVSSVSEDCVAPFSVRAGDAFSARIHFERMPLNVGEYSVTVAIRSGKSRLDRVGECLTFQVIDSPHAQYRLVHSRTYGFLRWPAVWDVRNENHAAVRSAG